MKFGICFKGDIGIGRTVRLAQQAEQGGFDYVWTFDSHVLWHEAYGMLTLIATHTERVRIGTLVTNPRVRRVDVAASFFATLNEISGGRAVCGLGRGDSSRRMLGKKPTTIANMMKTARELKRLAEGGSIVIDGVEITLTWANPQYELPMWLAGYGPKVLYQSGKIADGIVLQIAEPSLIRWFIEQVQKGAAEVGRDARSIRYMAAAPVFCSDDMEKCRAQCRWFPAMVGNHIADLIKNNAIGVPEDLLRAIEGRVDYDYKQHADKDSEHLDWVTDEVIDSFSVLGPVDNQIRKLRELEAAGVDLFVIYLMCEEEEEVVEIYSREIIPALQSRPRINPQ